MQDEKMNSCMVLHGQLPDENHARGTMAGT